MSGQAKLRVRLLPTGAANIASVRAGLERAGAEVLLGGSPEQVVEAEAVVLPGVGAFGPAMERLRSAGWDGALKERIEKERPTLCVCLGLQLLFEASGESPGAEGLGLLSGSAEPFPGSVVSPHFGWNRVEPESAGLIEPGYAYYANSYRVTGAPEGWTVSRTGHGGRFVAALQRGPVLACQFHPELSGRWGRALLERWVETAAREA
jgi:imidazole glycerol phosphate synthase glutamine amidotransferase subunit